MMFVINNFIILNSELSKEFDSFFLQRFFSLLTLFKIVSASVFWKKFNLIEEVNGTTRKIKFTTFMLRFDLTGQVYYTVTSIKKVWKLSFSHQFVEIYFLKRMLYSQKFNVKNTFTRDCIILWVVVGKRQFFFYFIKKKFFYNMFSVFW